MMLQERGRWRAGEWSRTYAVRWREQVGRWRMAGWWPLQLRLRRPLRVLLLWRRRRRLPSSPQASAALDFSRLPLHLLQLPLRLREKHLHMAAAPTARRQRRQGRRGGGGSGG